MKTWTTKCGYLITRALTGRSNVFLLTAGQTHILIDTSPRFLRNALLKSMGTLGIKNIDYLVITHAHFDHAGNAAIIRQNFMAKVIIHKTEAPFLASGENVGIKGTKPFTRFLLKTGRRMMDSFTYDPCMPDILAGSRYDFSEENIKVYLLHTPGHTPGSMSLILDDEIAIVGDTMFGIFPRSVFPPFGEDKRQIIQSWKLLLETGCRLFLPAHGSGNSRRLVEKKLKLEA